METEKDKELRKRRNDFFVKIKAWLEPLGFKEIFNNHPNLTPPRIDMVGKGGRVCCFGSIHDEYYYVNNEVYLKKEKEILTLRTGQYSIGNTEVLFNNLKVVSDTKRKIEKPNMFSKLRNLFS